MKNAAETAGRDSNTVYNSDLAVFPWTDPVAQGFAQLLEASGLDALISRCILGRNKKPQPAQRAIIGEE